MTRASHRLTTIAALTAGLYAARRYYRNWGATKEECQLPLPGDELVGEPIIQVTEATSVDAPPSVVWPSLLQTEDWQQLTVGDVLPLAPNGWMGLRNGLSLRVDAITPEQTIVFRTCSPNLPKAVWSFHLQPLWSGHTRLIARARVGLRHPGQVFVVELARPAIALMTRGVLVAIRRRVQRNANGLATSEFLS